MAAYAELIDRAREVAPKKLDIQSRRDIFFVHLIDRPSHYRGIPVHLLGTVRRVLRYESKLSRHGWLYEAWIFTPDGQNHPYVCVFEDPPAGFPIGSDLSERVVFNGYFLKLMAYQADDKARFAPLLIGRLGWSPETGSTNATSHSTTYWVLLIIGVLFLISFGRWVVQLRSLLTKRRGDEAPAYTRSHEDISPEALAGFLDSLTEDKGEHDDETSEDSTAPS